MLEINDKTQSRQLNLVLATTQSSMFIPFFFSCENWKDEFFGYKGLKVKNKYQNYKNVSIHFISGINFPPFVQHSMMAHSDKIENYLNTTWDAYVIAYTKIGLPWRTVDHDQESIKKVSPTCRL